MKTLKISLVATIAGALAWYLGFSRIIWPEHPHSADFLLALVICLVLQFTWPEQKKPDGQNSDQEKTGLKTREARKSGLKNTAK